MWAEKGAWPTTIKERFLPSLSEYDPRGKSNRRGSGTLYGSPSEFLSIENFVISLKLPKLLRRQLTPRNDLKAKLKCQIPRCQSEVKPRRV